MNIFTHNEKTNKKHKLELAINQAKAVIANSLRRKALCVNTINKKDKEALYTLQEISQITEDLVQDTFYYEGF